MNDFSGWNLLGRRDGKRRPERSFISPAAIVQSLEARLLLAAPELNMSRNIWDISNNVTTEVSDVTHRTKLVKGKPVVSATLVQVSVENEAPLPFSSGNLVIVFKGALPVGVTPGGASGGFTSGGDAYFRLGSLGKGQTRTPTFTFNGKLPKDFNPEIQILAVQVPPTAPPSVVPAVDNAMGAIDRTKFYAGFEAQFGQLLSPTQKTHLNQLLSFIENDSAIKDLRWAAYMLSTVYHEAGMDFDPASLENGGRKPSGNTDDYWKPVLAPNGRQQVYYGRGYSQITWAYHYALFGSELHNQGVLSSPHGLLNDPSLANTPAIAYKILSYGMRAGAFVSKQSLATHIHGDIADYESARKIINPNAPSANARLLAQDARKFETIIRSSVNRSAVAEYRVELNGGILSATIGFRFLGSDNPPVPPTFHVSGTFTIIESAEASEVGTIFTIDMDTIFQDDASGQVRYFFFNYLQQSDGSLLRLLGRKLTYNLSITRSDQSGVYASGSGVLPFGTVHLN